MTRWPRQATLAALLAFAGWHGVQGLYIEVKARLAQYLVRRAWEASRAGASHARPWPWADTEPVARLVVPGEDVDLIVLAGASGRTLAFGPGHLAGTARPGDEGNAVVSGHRDTHFSFLGHLKPGDELAVERRDGRWRRYVVAGSEVVDRRDAIVTTDKGDTRLTLVTCYPFHALRPGGPLRYVVTALLARDPDLPARGRWGATDAEAPRSSSEGETRLHLDPPAARGPAGWPPRPAVAWGRARRKASLPRRARWGRRRTPGAP